MTLAINDIVRMKCFQTMQGVDLLNVYYLQFVGVDSGTPNLLEFTESWAEFMNDNVWSFLSTGLTVDRVLAENLTDGVSLTDLSTTYVGTSAGDAMPAFNAISVTMNRQTKATRNGSKRIAGLPEAYQNSGTLSLPASLVTGINDTHGTAVIFDDLNEGALKQWSANNVIVGRTLVGGVYVEDLTRINGVLAPAIKSKVASQVSRRS